MTPRRSIVGTVARWPVINHPWLRRIVIAVAIALCAILTLFPQQYRAAATLTPTDPTSLGLSGTLGQLGAVGSVFGNQAAVEVSLKIARSEYVKSLVAKRLKLSERLGESPLEVHRWLDRNVNARALRGGIIEFEVKQRDAEFARMLVAAYSTAVRDQLAVVSRTQTEKKREILMKLVESSSERLATAQRAFDSYRLQTRYSDPRSAITAIGDRVPQLESAIRSKQMELNTLREFATDENMRVRQALAEVATLRAELAEARSVSPAQTASVGRVVRATTAIDKLRRELDLAQSLYDNYTRYLQGTSVEDLTSSANVRILEPPFVDSSRQLNLLPLSVGLFLFLLLLTLEFYWIRPPVSDGTLA